MPTSRVVRACHQQYHVDETLNCKDRPTHLPANEDSGKVPQPGAQAGQDDEYAYYRVRDRHEKLNGHKGVEITQHEFLIDVPSTLTPTGTKFQCYRC